MKKVLSILALAVLANCAISCFVNRMKNPKKTETELMIDIPKSFIWDFK